MEVASVLHVVTGPPCSGKTTYVNEHRQSGDVVVDLDSLASALGAESRYEYTGAIRDAAFAARAAAIESVGDSDAWVIHSKPTQEQRAGYAGATFHDLNPGIDECIARSKRDGRPDWTENVIKRWYDESSPARGSVHIRPARAADRAPRTPPAESGGIPAQPGREAIVADTSTAQAQEQNTPQGEGTNQTASIEQSGTQERTYTQAEVDELLGGYVEQSEVNRLVGEARRKTRSKFEGYDEYKAAAEAHADYDEVASARDSAQAEVEALRAQIAHRDLVDKVSADTGVPGSLLHGDTEDELTASAKAVAAYAKAQQPAYPEDKGGGASPAAVTKEQILAERDTQKRQRLIAENISLFQ